MPHKKKSIFNRLLLAFVAVGIATGVPMVLLAIKFNKDSSALRLEQSVTQQMAIISDNFERELSIGLQRSLKQVAESDALKSYLSASGDERIVSIKVLETNLLRIQGEYRDYSGIYYADADGELIVNVVDGQRQFETGNLSKEAAPEGGTPPSATRVHLKKLFQTIKTTPLLLSSGNMEWFMPPREVIIEGPFIDENNRLTILTGLSTIDYDNGGFGGLVIIRMRLDTFVSRLKSVKFYELNPIWLFSSTDQLLVAPAEKSLGLNPVEFLPKGSAKELQFQRIDKGLVAVQDLSIVKDKPLIRIAYAIPSSLILKDYQPAIYYFLLVLLILLTAIGALAFFVSRKFSTPIIELAQASSRLAEGVLATRVTVTATGEIGVLVDSFNQMSERLQIADKNRHNAFDVLRNTIAKMQNDDKPAPLGAEAADTPENRMGILAHREDSEDLRAIAEVIDKLIGEREDNLRGIQAAKTSADEANRAKGDFLATMSHEIRTPLNVVIGLTDVLSATELNSKQQHLVSTMETAGGQLLQIINDVLDFSRLQAGSIELSDSIIDLSAFMSRLMLLIGGLPGASRLDIQCTIDPAVPPRMLGDDARLMQILTNLMGNAVKFTKEGSISIDVGTALDADGATLIRFAVADTGSGIPQELREQIFEPFKQGSAERLRPHAGSGLGLAICRKLAAAMGGVVDLLPDTGQGACFTISLPLRQFQETSEASPVISNAPYAGLPLHILVAEDTPANQLVIRLMLQGMGHTVTLVSNGLEAVNAFLGSESFDVVFLDIQMPVMDGYEAAKQIRSSGRSGLAVPIVALTAFTQNSDRDKAKESGVTHFLSKPIRAKDISLLLETITATEVV